MSAFNSQLWAPKAQPPTENLVMRPNMVPGTWLVLSPDASPKSAPLPSPSLKDESASAVDLNELSLNDSRRKSETYLSNTSSASRQSSVSSRSSGSVSTRAPAFLTTPSVERREMAVGRVGGVGAAFLAN